MSDGIFRVLIFHYRYWNQGNGLNKCEELLVILSVLLSSVCVSVHNASVSRGDLRVCLCAARVRCCSTRLLVIRWSRAGQMLNQSGGRIWTQRRILAVCVWTGASAAHTHTHTLTHWQRHTHTLSLSLSHTHTHTPHTHSLSLSLTHTHTHTTPTLSLSHTHTHTLSHIHTHTLTETHTHTHTHTHIDRDTHTHERNLITVYLIRFASHLHFYWTYLCWPILKWVLTAFR